MHDAESVEACFVPNHVQRSVTVCDRPRFSWCRAGVFAAGPAGSWAGVPALCGAAGTEVCAHPCALFQVWKISLQGPCYMTVLMVAFGLLWGHLLQIRPTQSVFISTCLSLSSTPLVSKFLVGSARSDKEGRWPRVLSVCQG